MSANEHERAPNRAEVEAINRAARDVLCGLNALMTAKIECYDPRRWEALQGLEKQLANVLTGLLRLGGIQ